MSQDAKGFDRQAELYRVMAQPVRLRVIDLLKDGPQRVASIAERLGMPQARLSRHLAVLLRAGIVYARRHGSEVSFEIANPKIISVCNLMRVVLTERKDWRAKLFKLLNESSG